MRRNISRRDFIKLTGIGGVVFASGLGFDVLAKQPGKLSHRAEHDFYFAQLSDCHWGFNNAQVNPNADITLYKAIKDLNSLKLQPDFVVFTGDLTHTTDDPKERRQRMRQFRDIVDSLRVKNLKFLPGEHDASLDHGEAYREFFGELYYSFDHKGIHFIALDNVSDPTAILGQKQLDWLKADLQQRDAHAPIVVLTHRPLFNLYQQWDWFTRDGQIAIDLLLPFSNVAVFYGHIHQKHFQATQHIKHYAANSLIFPLPAPGSVEKRAPIPWNPNQPYTGLGYRNIDADAKHDHYDIEEYTLKEGGIL